MIENRRKSVCSTEPCSRTGVGGGPGPLPLDYSLIRHASRERRLCVCALLTRDKVGIRLLSHLGIKAPPSFLRMPTHLTPSICTIRLPSRFPRPRFVRRSGDFDQGISGLLPSSLSLHLSHPPTIRRGGNFETGFPRMIELGSEPRGKVRGRVRICLRLSGSWENSRFNGRTAGHQVFHTSCFRLRSHWK